uniref:Uncharacterized protein n=1 Tax=Arundo donax TaxID=35708 RepID=A0A0A9C844_ARUDO
MGKAGEIADFGNKFTETMAFTCLPIYHHSIVKSVHRPLSYMHSLHAYQLLRYVCWSNA